MEKFTALFQAVIAFCAVFTALGLMFNILLGPVKENQRRLEKELETVNIKLNIKLDKLIEQHHKSASVGKKSLKQ